jgi:3-oxoacyl-[acyl-carrier protein] reductase
MADGNRELHGKVAVVTGAGRNIGRAIALSLAAAGAAVIVNARANKAEAESVVKEIEKAGGRALPYLADISNPKAVDAMAAAAVARFNRIDFLINNASLRREKSIDDMTLADWREVVAVTLDGAFICVKACLGALKRSGAGVIVNIGGMSGHTGSKNRAHVVAAKAGLAGFTRALAHDLADDRVTANCVVPGLIATSRPAGAPEPQHHMVHRTLTGARGASEDIAAVVCFLCGPGARYVTGQTIHVNGGAFLG